MNINKIEFIVCVNNERYFEECEWYIKRLVIPNGFEVKITPIRGAVDIANAYNKSMSESDAQYKVYLHQDTFILNRDFISDIVSIFGTDLKIGLIGVLGGKPLPNNAICYDNWNLGGTYACNVLNTFNIERGNPNHKITDYYEAEAIDGMIMVTRYDIPWRSDLNYGWDFYDVSQSLEFIRAGWKVIIPRQKELWCLHDCGISKLKQYDISREIIMKEYDEVFSGTFETQGYHEMNELSEKIVQLELVALENGDIKQLFQIDSALYGNGGTKSNKSVYIHIFLLILLKESEADENTFSFMGAVNSFDEMLDKYTEVKFYIRRCILEKHDYSKIEKEAVLTYGISKAAFEIIYHCVSY